MCVNAAVIGTLGANALAYSCHAVVDEGTKLSNLDGRHSKPSPITISAEAQPSRRSLSLPFPFLELFFRFR